MCIYLIPSGIPNKANICEQYYILMPEEQLHAVQNAILTEKHCLLL